VAESDLAEVATGLIEPANIKIGVPRLGSLLVTPATPISISIAVIGPSVAITVIGPIAIVPIAIVTTAVVVAYLLDWRIRYGVSIQQPGHGSGCRTRAYEQSGTQQ
jgi:hypothetical protein